MTIKHSRTATFEHKKGYDPGGQYLTTYSHTPNISGFPQCVLTVDKGQVRLEWEQGLEKQIEIASGNLSLNSTTDRTKRAVLQLQPGKFPPATSGSLVFEGSVEFNRDSYLNYYINLAVDLAKEHTEYAETFSALTKSRLPNDVCFFFPRTGHTLWASEIVLSNASPYLSSLLRSGFSESTSHKSSLGGAGDTSAEFKPFEFEDSDEERDNDGNVKRSSTSEELNVTFKKVEITETTYTTYFNVICWIGTGYIEFAPLKSLKPSKPSKPFEFSFTAPPLPSQNSSSSLSTRKPSSLPIPASPKSIYRLSHLLELPELSKLALANFKSQLTPQNVAYELYTDVSDTHSEIRDVALEYAVENWKEVVKSKALGEVEKKARSGEGVDSWTVMLLSKKLMERWVK